MLYAYKIIFFTLIKAFLTINLIAAIVFIINLLIDANYMFLIHKPRSTSLLDILGPYPYYLIALEGIVIIVFFILYLPFISKKNAFSYFFILFFSSIEFFYQFFLLFFNYLLI